MPPRPQLLELSRRINDYGHMKTFNVALWNETGKARYWPAAAGCLHKGSPGDSSRAFLIACTPPLAVVRSARRGARPPVWRVEPASQRLRRRRSRLRRCSATSAARA